MGRKKKDNKDGSTTGGQEGPQKEKESKIDKFHRLAEHRINNAINSLRVLGNLSNRNQYDYTEEDVDKMFTALNEIITNVNQKYQEGLKKGAQNDKGELPFKFSEEGGKL